MICDKKMNFHECELAILRQSIDKIEESKGKQLIDDPNIKEIVNIVEQFLRDKKLICYGGTAINNILPKKDQFYNYDIELPDYDFFSKNPLNDAKQLADIYAKKGFEKVEAKAGVHHGTFKVFVNFIPIADITYLVPEIFNNLKKEAIVIDGIYYTPPNYLRMSMYLELSRPRGDISRWEKVLKRLTLFNKNFPLKIKDCENVDIQRNFSNEKIDYEKIFNITRETLIKRGVVFFGAYANHYLLKYLKSNKRNKLQKIPDFDVLSESPETTATVLKLKLNKEGIDNVKIIEHEGIGEVIPVHYEVKVGKDTIVFIYKPLACHSYNVINVNGEKIKIATIDTMLSYYLAFLYSDKKYYDKDRILCMSELLFKIQEKNRLKQKGLLRRFTLKCIGKQQTIEDVRSEKAKKYEELKNKKNTRTYDEYFLNYNPLLHNKKIKKQMAKKTKKNNNKKAKKTKKTKKVIDIV